MSNTKKIEISNVEIDVALSEISELSKGSKGLIINKNGLEGISQVLSGANVDIQKIAENKSNQKVISNDVNEVEIVNTEKYDNKQIADQTSKNKEKPKNIKGASPKNSERKPK